MIMFDSFMVKPKFKPTVTPLDKEKEEKKKKEEM